MTIVVGLTGSIGTGKSTIASMLKRLKIPVQESDTVVHQLFEFDDIKTKIANVFPAIVHNNSIDKSALGRIVFQDRLELIKLEAIVHPLVKQYHDDFIFKHRCLNTPLIVLDIPLLFEINLQEFFDKIVVTNCRTEVQYERVLKRPTMNISYLENIIANQWPAEKKCAMANYIINTNNRKLDTYQQVRALLAECLSVL